MTVVLLSLVAAGIGLAVGSLAARARARRLAGDASAQVKEIRTAAEAEVERIRRARELEAREAAHEVRTQAESAEKQADEQLKLRVEIAERREQTVEKDATESAAREAELSKRENDVRSREGQIRASREQIPRIEEEMGAKLEQIAGETRRALVQRLVDGWVEECKAQGAARVRTIEASSADPEHGRQAKRIMGIAIQRYQGHYLTERLLSNLALEEATAARVIGPEERNLRVIEEATNIKLTLSETGTSVRLEGLDGIGREVARRAIRKLEKDPRNADKDPVAFVKGIQQRVDQEIQELGKKAFSELEIAKAHPEIVTLVGRLNWRTSYTQNQWKHAVEVAFLCGMMANELGLDVKLARRAALMHDIGKSLTHAIDGSHAVIGADYARRLGEAEVVANAIGAHHADEPCNSLYAYIVAAADAMSGARPGARREQSDNYIKRLQDLERIGLSFRGVSRVAPVGGGREVRVYVKEGDITDEAAVSMSSEIARKISDELTFPGQIKVTVIRQIEAVEFAR